MKYILKYKIFENSNFQKLINDITEKANKFNVKLILPETNTVKYITGESEVSGYFVDNGEPTLACAIGGDIERWGPKPITFDNSNYYSNENYETNDGVTFKVSIVSDMPLPPNENY